MTNAHTQSEKALQTFERVVEVLWTNPRIADLLLSEKRGWSDEISEVAMISLIDLEEMINATGIDRLKEIARENPVEAFIPVSRGDSALQFGAKTNTCGTCACGTNTCGTCHCGTGTCGTCLCINPPGMNL